MPKLLQRFFRRNIRSFVSVILCLTVIGCEREVPSRDAEVPVLNAEIPAQRVSSNDSTQHVSHEIVQQFIADCQTGKYADSPLDFPCDFELSPDNRLKAFRKLERYIQSDSWTITYTAVHIIKGREDLAEIYLRNSAGRWMLLSCGFYYQTDEWKLDTYEIPEMAFARPENETFEEYMQQSLEKIRETAKPYSTGETADGIYFIE